MTNPKSRRESLDDAASRRIRSNLVRWTRALWVKSIRRHTLRVVCKPVGVVVSPFWGYMPTAFVMCDGPQRWSAGLLASDGSCAVVTAATPLDALERLRPIARQLVRRARTASNAAQPESPSSAPTAA